jgi:hypothetical protein
MMKAGNSEYVLVGVAVLTATRAFRAKGSQPVMSRRGEEVSGRCSVSGAICSGLTETDKSLLPAVQRRPLSAGCEAAPASIPPR